jgi:hypothetical protein
MMIKTSFFTQPLECESIRAGNWCQGGYWEADAVKLLLAPLVFVWAVIIWFVAQLAANPIAQYIHRDWRPVDPILYRRIVGLTIIALAFLLCGHWVYFLYPKYGYGTSVLLPFFAVGMVGVLSSSRR